MSNDQIAEKETDARLHISHVDVPNHTGNRYESDARQRGAYHAEGDDVPWRLAVTSEKGVVVTSLPRQTGNYQ